MSIGNNVYFLPVASKYTNLPLLEHSQVEGEGEEIKLQKDVISIYFKTVML